MVVRCIKCKARLAVPDERAGDLSLKLKCPGCGLVFPLGKAPRAATVAKPVAAAAGGAAGIAPGFVSLAKGPAVGIHTPAASAPEALPRPAPGERPLEAVAGCANHPSVRSIAVCIACDKGWCSACGKRVGNIVICPACEGPTVSPVRVLEARAAVVRRATPLLAQLPEIANYPFQSMVAFSFAYLVIIGLTVASFNPITGLYMYLLRESLLVGISLMCIIQVANAKPVFELTYAEDRGTLREILSLGLAVLVVLQAPRLIWGLVAPPGVVDMVGSWLLLAWSIAYAPMAFICAAVSRSMAAVVQPWLGFGAIQRMGRIYWQAAGIHIGAHVGAVIAAGIAFSAPTIFEITGTNRMTGTGLLVRVLFLIWIEVYLAFALGALLGHAVDKCARELDLE